MAKNKAKGRSKIGKKVRSLISRLVSAKSKLTKSRGLN